MLGKLMLMSIISIVFSSLIPYILTSLICWNLFKKFGVESWKGLIPVYRYVVLFKKIKVSLLYYWGPIVAMFMYFVSAVYRTFLLMVNFNRIDGALGLEPEPSIIEAILPLLMIGSGIVAVVLFIIGQVKKAKQLAKAFNKSTGFAVGLGLLEGLFLLILAFSKDTFDSSKL